MTKKQKAMQKVYEAMNAFYKGWAAPPPVHLSEPWPPPPDFRWPGDGLPDPATFRGGPIFTMDFNSKPPETVYPDEWAILISGQPFRLMDSNEWYWCHCEDCGWQDSSEFAGGGAPMGETGDFTDPCCPKCFSNRIEGPGINGKPEYEGLVYIPLPKNQAAKRGIPEGEGEE